MNRQREAALISAVRTYVDGVSGDYRTTPPESTAPAGLAGMTSSDKYVSGALLEEWPGRSAVFRQRWEDHTPETRRDIMIKAFPEADPVTLMSGTAAPAITRDDEENTPVTSGVEIGAVLTRVYYQMPEWHGHGDVFDDHAEACAHARLHKDRLRLEGLDNRVYVDTRWVMTHPDSGVTCDVRVEHVEFAPDETRKQWEARALPTLTEVAVHVDMHDTEAAHDWAQQVLFKAGGALITAARVDDDGHRHPAEVIHRNHALRIVTRDNPGVLDRVTRAVLANPPDPDRGPATIVVYILGEGRAWNWNTSTPDAEPFFTDHPA